MSALLANVLTIPLDARQTAEVLARAVSEQAGLELSGERNRDCLVLTGTLTSESASGLTVRVDCGTVPAGAEGDRMMVFATLDLPGTRYLFDAVVLASRRAGGATRLTVSRPRTMAVLERRRTPRRRLRHTAAVVLHAPVAGSAWRCEGRLLNLRRDGMACLVEAPQDGILNPGRLIRAVFRPLPGSPEFDLPARVANVTEGAGRGHRIVGLEFVNSDPAQPERSRLIEILKREADREE